MLVVCMCVFMSVALVWMNLEQTLHNNSHLWRTFKSDRGSLIWMLLYMVTSTVCFKPYNFEPTFIYHVIGYLYIYSCALGHAFFYHLFFSFISLPFHGSLFNFVWSVLLPMPVSEYQMTHKCKYIVCYTCIDAFD